VSKPNTLRVEPSGLLEIVARRAQIVVLSALLEAKLGIAFPEPGRATSIATCAALWIGPERSLLLADATIMAAIREAVTPVRAALIDQSSGYTIWRLTGPDARSVLTRICRIDLHDRVFDIDNVARTIMAQVPTILHSIDGDASFRLIVPRTFSCAFAQSIKHAANACGIDLQTTLSPSEPTS
jgi:methylglutamate dehydrogenase subunit C